MKTKIFLLLITIALVSSCRKKSDNGTARIVIKLTDAPGPYQEVNVDIQSVEYHIAGGTQIAGWKTITTFKGMYNLLDLVNGFDTVIAAADIPSGRISQIRLILGSNNTIKDSAGTVYPLTVSSGSESGLKIQVHTYLDRDLEYEFLLDFDASKSIVYTGSNSYLLKPVIRLISSNTTGSIKGVVTPSSVMPSIVATNGSDSAGTFPDAAGNYLIKGLNAGTYDVKFSPASTYSDSTITGVNVVTGQVTVLDTLRY